MTATIATTDPAAPTTTTDRGVPASTSIRRKGLGIAVIAGGIVSVAGYAATEWEGSEKKIDYLNSLVVDPTRSQVAALLLHFGYMAFAGALLVLAALTRGVRSKFVTGMFALAGAGAVTLPGLLVTDFYDLAIRQTLPDAQAVATSDKASDYGLGAIMAVPTVFGIMLGLFALLVTAARKGRVHWVVAPVFLVGFLLPVFVPAGGWAVNVGGAVLTFGALAVLGVKALRMTDAQWVHGR